MAYEELLMPQFGVPYDQNLDQAVDFILVANTIDFAFTDFSSHVKFQVDYQGRHTSDSKALLASMKRALDEGIPLLEGRYLAQVTRPALEPTFRGNTKLPRPTERVQVL